MSKNYLIYYIACNTAQSGGEGWKILTVSHCFSSIFNNLTKINGLTLSVTVPARIYNSYNSANVSG